MSPRVQALWRRAEPFGLPLLALALALCACGVAIAVLGASPGGAAAAIAEGAFGSLRALGETSLKATALTFTGLAVAVPLAAGFFNIGGQGQFLVGAVCAAWLGRALGLPRGLLLPMVLGAAALLGAGYAAIAAWLKLYRGVHEVISSILLNWIAIHLINDWLVVGPLAQSSAGGRFASGGTSPIALGAHLPLLLGAQNRLNLGLALAWLCAAACAFFVQRTPRGLELRASGDAPATARALGIPLERRALLAMAVGGACAGLGGACLLLGGGTDFRYPENYRDSYGFDGIAVALLGAGHPLGVCFTALLFGALRAGAVRLQDPSLGLHRAWPDIAQALAVLAVAGKPALRRLWRRPLTAVPSPAFAEPEQAP